ncbi:MAG: putative ABC transport system ATP-binding protein, partial [Alteromonadaceae bacterium]
NEEQRAQLRAQSVGFIFQAFMLVQSLTALENVMLPAELAGMDNAKQLAEQLLERVGLSGRIGHFPNQLSGGEQQRVAIARAFITQPKILFADEPSANLDSKNGHLIEDLLFELNQQFGATLVLVTHDNKLASRCERVLQMHDGQLSEESEQREEDQAYVV